MPCRQHEIYNGEYLRMWVMVSSTSRIILVVHLLQLLANDTIHLHQLCARYEGLTDAKMVSGEHKGANCH